MMQGFFIDKFAFKNFPAIFVKIMRKGIFNKPIALLPIIFVVTRFLSIICTIIVPQSL